MNTRRSVILFCATVLAVGSVRSDEPFPDEAVKAKIVDFVTLPSRLCGKATMDFRNELRERKLTNRAWFDGDTNRLARLIAELAQTNDVELSSMMINALGEYGTPTQLPFLCSCATNPIVGDKAIKAALRIGGVTSNSVEAAQRYFALTNTDASVDRSRTSICADLIKLSGLEGVDDICRSNAMEVAQNFAFSADCNYYWLDKLRLEDDPSYRYSKRRLAFMRGAASHAAQWEFMANYVTNAINELVAYPEANLPN